MRLALAGLLALAPAAAGAAQAFDLPDGPGRALVYGHCQTCHDLQSVLDSARIRRGAWDAVLDNMRDFGLRITADQRSEILDYLATYLGPEPPPEVAPAAVASAADGAAVYAETCTACHQPDGTGKPGEFPPLANNPDLFLSPEFPALVALNGLAGPIDVGDAHVDGEMPSFDFLSDAEITAVVAYVRGKWGNAALAPADLPPLTADDVAAARGRQLTPAGVHDLRGSLLP